MISIPTVTPETALALSLQKGSPLFVLGANGTGKSSLMHKLNSQAIPFVDAEATASEVERVVHREWIQGQRTVAFDPNRQIRTYSTEQQFYNNYLASLSDPAQRYSSSSVESTRSYPLSRFTAKINESSRLFEERVRANPEQANALSLIPGLLETVNELLRLSNLPIELQIEGAENVQAMKANSEPYDFSALSDGERSAILLIMQVLTAPEDSLLIIDEPERHLHRAISVPLLQALFEYKPELYFVISTHELGLPLAFPDSPALLTRSVSFTGEAPAFWDLSYFERLDQFDEQLRRDILGARRQLLYIEGTEGSRDFPLYSLLFPGVSIFPRASCRDVEQTVKRLRAESNLHDLEVYGIVDLDNRTLSEVQALEQEGVFALPIRTVESILYHPDLLAMVATKNADTLGLSAEVIVGQATQGMLQALEANKQHLADRVAEGRIRELYFAHLPKRTDIQQGTAINVQIDVSRERAVALEQIEELLERGNLAALVERYPVRSSAALRKVAEAFQVRDDQAYERLVLSTLKRFPDALQMVKDRFDPLNVALRNRTSAISHAD